MAELPIAEFAFAEDAETEITPMTEAIN